MIGMRMWWLIKDHHDGNDNDIIDKVDNRSQEELDQDKLLKFLMEPDDVDKVDNELDFDIY